MSTQASIRPIVMLMVEDSPADVMLTKEALDQAKVLNHLHLVEDGVAAMAFCYPGTDPKGGDFPPPARCASLWRRRLLQALPLEAEERARVLHDLGRMVARKLAQAG